MVGLVRRPRQGPSGAAALDDVGSANSTWPTRPRVAAFADDVLADGTTARRADRQRRHHGLPRRPGRPGFELQFGTNHLGHFVLVNRLLPLLARRRAGRQRLVAGHRFSDVRSTTRGSSTAYDAWEAYGRAKTANVLFAVELDRLGARPRGARPSLHPGGIITELGRHLQAEELDAVRPRRRRARR